MPAKPGETSNRLKRTPHPRVPGRRERWPLLLLMLMVMVPVLVGDGDGRSVQVSATFVASSVGFTTGGSHHHPTRPPRLLSTSLPSSARPCSLCAAAALTCGSLAEDYLHWRKAAGLGTATRCRGGNSRSRHALWWAKG